MSKENQAETKEKRVEDPVLFFEDPPKKKGGKWPIFILILLAAGLGFYFLFLKVPVIHGEAVLQARERVEIGIKTPGVLTEIIRKKWDRVTQGEILARFENREIASEIEERKLEIERAKLDRSVIQKKIDFLGREIERKTILAENGVIGQALLEKAALEIDQQSELIKSKEKEIEAIEGRVLFLNEKLKTLEIKAPFSGVVIEDPSPKLGNYLKEGDMIFEIADPSSFYLEFPVPEVQVNRIRIGSQVTVNFFARPNQSFQGEIVKIGSKTEKEVEKVFKVRHVVPCEINLKETLPEPRIGMRAEVIIRSLNDNRSDIMRLTKSK